MKVLKFGGSSVANAENMSKVVEIVITSAAEQPCLVVLSAMQSTTDKLIEAGKLAERGDDGFLEKIGDIRTTHLAAVESLFPDGVPGELEEFVETALGDLENICEGIIRVGELSGRTLDRILSFGELVSSRIVAEAIR
ncbi:MAG: hypothetical protein QUS14_07060, partial [Pyrinomonadaceae bacterium]|nr:hypothetical protein [Pyrinomonadaceae bacterium]